MKYAHDIIRRPIISEKSMSGIADKKYTFEVSKDANKIEIKNAIETVFKGVKVKSVNTVNVTGKMKRVGVHTGRRPSYKKAIVTLTADSKTIEFFESMA